GTNTGPADDERRAWLLADWLARVYLPAWLRAAGLDEPATAVEALPPLRDGASWEAARLALDEAQSASDAVWYATWSAVNPAADDAARSAAGDAAGEAVRCAANDPAWSAASDAA